MAEEEKSAQASQEAPRTARRIEAPTFYASQMQAYLAGNDYIIAFARPHPVAVEGQPFTQAAAIVEPVAIVHLSPETMKDLYLLTKTQIEHYEKQFGTIETDYSRRVATRK